jgi:hypothetical protein
MGAERLTSVDRIDDQRLPSEILELVVLGVDPRRDALFFFRADTSDRLYG